MSPRILDWRSNHDPRSLNFPIRSILRSSVNRVDRQWPGGTVLDQGYEGACVGFAWTSEALAHPVPVDLTRLRAYAPKDPFAFARFVYRSAQHIDEWNGETYEGTSVLAGAKTMWNLGLLNGYRWAFGIEDVADTVSTYGPVVVGTNWYSGMYSAPDGLLTRAGTLVGGHAYLVTGYTKSNPRLGGAESLTVKNSWGPSWGRNGFADITLANMASLLAEQGEACVPTSRSYGRS